MFVVVMTRVRGGGNSGDGNNSGGSDGTLLCYSYCVIVLMKKENIAT